MASAELWTTDSTGPWTGDGQQWVKGGEAGSTSRR